MGWIGCPQVQEIKDTTTRAALGQRAWSRGFPGGLPVEVGLHRIAGGDHLSRAGLHEEALHLLDRLTVITEHEGIGDDRQQINEEIGSQPVIDYSFAAAVLLGETRISGDVILHFDAV
jgi:hypothetical protein